MPPSLHRRGLSNRSLRASISFSGKICVMSGVVSMTVFDQPQVSAVSRPSTPPVLKDQVLPYISGGEAPAASYNCNNGDNGVPDGAHSHAKTEAFVPGLLPPHADHIRAAVRAVQLHELLRVVGRDGEHIGIALAHKAQPRRIRGLDDDPCVGDAVWRTAWCRYRSARHRG